MANPVTQIEVLEKAREDAIILTQNDPQLNTGEQFDQEHDQEAVSTIFGFNISRLTSSTPVLRKLNTGCWGGLKVSL